MPSRSRHVVDQGRKRASASLTCHRPGGRRILRDKTRPVFPVVRALCRPKYDLGQLGARKASRSNLQPRDMIWCLQAWPCHIYTNHDLGFEIQRILEYASAAPSLVEALVNTPRQRRMRGGPHCMRRGILRRAARQRHSLSSQAGQTGSPSTPQRSKSPAWARYTKCANSRPSPPWRRHCTAQP